MFASPAAAAREVGQRRVDRRLVAARAPCDDRVALLGLQRRVDGEDPAVGALDERRALAALEAVDADEDLLARLDAPDALAVRVDERALHVVDRADRAAVLGDDRELGLGAVDELGDEAVHHLRALEEVGVLEQVGLEGEHLLDAQRPLLVPRPREAERLVPGRQLDRPRASVAAERHRERLEHDALDVVLRLRLRQAERVDLHAVAEAEVALVGDAVAVAAEPLPHRRHRAELRVLLDEPHAGVDEERDPPEDPGDALVADPLADRVEDGDRVRERVRDLLDRRRARLLQVVRADVHRVPARDVLDRIGDHVGDQAHRRAGRERVGPAGEELLDDVVLRRALERRRIDAVLLGGDDVEGEQPGGRRVDRHRRVHLGERDAVHSVAMSPLCATGTPTLPTSPRASSWSGS